jgi:uncharacterized protein (TIGR00255 family)
MSKPVYSMTAFSRVEEAFEEITLAWEIRSVNHRYLDLNLRLPDTFRFIEPGVREFVRTSLQRGKVDCTLHFQVQSGKQSVTVNEEALKGYLSALDEVGKLVGDAAPVNALELLFKPGVLLQQEMDKELLKQQAMALLEKTMQQHIAGREREGSELKALINQRLEKVSAHVETLRPQIPQIIQNQRDKLLDRLKELDVELDEGRLEQEATYIAQKLDVDEELDRLETHVNEVGRTLEKGGPVGRRLDFLMQELNREANTLSSKSASTDSTHVAVELKVLIEQMREQIQNLE